MRENRVKNLRKKGKVKNAETVVHIDSLFYNIK